MSIIPPEIAAEVTREW